MDVFCDHKYKLMNSLVINSKSNGIEYTMSGSDSRQSTLLQMALSGLERKGTKFVFHSNLHEEHF